MKIKIKIKNQKVKSNDSDNEQNIKFARYLDVDDSFHKLNDSNNSENKSKNKEEEAELIYVRYTPLYQYPEKVLAASEGMKAVHKIGYGDPTDPLNINGTTFLEVGIHNAPYGTIKCKIR